MSTRTYYKRIVREYEVYDNIVWLLYNIGFKDMPKETMLGNDNEVIGWHMFL